jgi:hypothetical protein
MKFIQNFGHKSEGERSVRRPRLRSEDRRSLSDSVCS